VEARITEIPSPVGVAMGERTEWLRRVMQATWSQVFSTDGAAYREFHDALVQWARSVRHDTVAFSHFIAINALIGSALNERSRAHSQPRQCIHHHLAHWREQ